MSVIQQHSSATLTDSWRTLHIDQLDPDSSYNFPLASLVPAGSSASSTSSSAPTLEATRALSAHVRQLLRAGDAEAAVRAALADPPYRPVSSTSDAAYAEGSEVREERARVVLEVLGGIRAGEIPGILRSLVAGEGEEVDVLVKYLYRGMATASGSASASASGLLPPSHSSSRGLTPQSTGGGAGGFSQIGAGRPAVANEGSGAAMSVLLSWHEKVVETAGHGCVVRCLSDWRRV